MAVSYLKPKKQPAHQNPSSTTLKGYTMKQYLLPIIAALLLGACTTYTYTPTLFRQERILGFYGEKAGTSSSTKPQMYIITNKNEYSIALPPIFQAAQQAGIFNDAVRYRLSMRYWFPPSSSPVDSSRRDKRLTRPQPGVGCFLS